MLFKFKCSLFELEKYWFNRKKRCKCLCKKNCNY